MASLESADHEYLSVVVCRWISSVDHIVDDNIVESTTWMVTLRMVTFRMVNIVTILLLGILSRSFFPSTELCKTPKYEFHQSMININITTIIIHLLIFTSIIIMKVDFFRPSKVFRVGPTSPRDEPGKSFWRKLLKLQETTISVGVDSDSDVDVDDGVDDYVDQGDGAPGDNYLGR